MPTVLLDTTDLDQAQTALSASFSRMHIRGNSGDSPTSLRVERQHVGPVCIDSADYGREFSYAMDPLEQIVVCRVVSGQLEAGHMRQPVARCQPGDVYAFGAVEGASYNGRVRPGHYKHLVVDRQQLGAVAVADPSIQLTGSVATSPLATQRLAKGIDYAHRLITRGAAETNPVLAAGLARYLVNLILATFPSTSRQEPAGDDRCGSKSMRRAAAFIDENAHTDISLGDIATATYVTPRTLQNMFRRHRDCTPMEYVRRVRLGYAHLDLLAGDPTTVTVGDIARRWGFGHVGRFSGYYRQTYSQSPHVTLRS